MRSVIKTGVVTEFRNEYAFLSNFFVADFLWRGELYPSAEHAFQAAKGNHLSGHAGQQPATRAAYNIEIRNAPTPNKAKYLGRSAKIDLDTWDAMRVQYMREIVHAKFKYVDGLAGKLINTGAMMLVEGNTWGDTFWGRVDGKGYNHLGVILMEERGYWLHHEFGE